MALKLKDAGINTPLAERIADWSWRVQKMSVNLGWDWQFAPFAGHLATEHTWFLEVADARYRRIGADANPNMRGLDYSDWTSSETRRIRSQVAPAVTVQVDISQIAPLLAGGRDASHHV